MTTKKKIIVPDEVLLNDLAELAAIPPGIGLWQPHKRFASDVLKCIRMVHDYGNILDASKLKRLKEIDYHAHELVKHLKASDKKKLFAIVSRDTIQGITGLARGARRAKLLAKAPRQGKWPLTLRIRGEHREAAGATPPNVIRANSDVCYWRHKADSPKMGFAGRGQARPRKPHQR